MVDQRSHFVQENLFLGGSLVVAGGEGESKPLCGASRADNRDSTFLRRYYNTIITAFTVKKRSKTSHHFDLRGHSVVERRRDFSREGQVTRQVTFSGTYHMIAI